MSKFKVGDKVRILDGSKIKNYTDGWCGSLKRYTGRNSTVIDVVDFVDGRVGYKLYDTNNFTFDERSLKYAEHETIVIYRKDNEVIALDKRTGKKAIAKCSPEDKFDFNIGAKLAFERLMNSDKESINVEDMRNKLDSYCFGRRCCGGCKLESPTYRCGRGAHFMTKDDAGNYTMSDEEIKHAFNIVFGTGIKEVKPKEPHKFKVGDIVKCNNPVRYCFTDDDMTRCKVTNVSEDGKYISVEILEHKRGSTCKFYGFESNCFDLVEEAQKLYNGKIIFTKGDEMFKTGHIYEVNDGRIKTVEYGKLPMREPLKDIEDVKDYFTGNLDGNRKREKGWSAYTLELMEVKED